MLNFLTDDIVIHDKQLVFFCGLAGSGKRTIIDRVNARIKNSAKFDKDIVNTEFVPGDMDLNSDHYKNNVKNQTYTSILKLAVDNLKQTGAQKIMLLEGYFGDKLTSPMVKPYLLSEDYTVKVVYVHCSSKKQFQRLIARNSPRDADKVDSIAYALKKPLSSFKEYRSKHLANHLNELAQVPHLLIDSENDASLDANVEKVIQYLQTPNLTKSIELLERRHDITSYDLLGYENEMCDATKFQSMICAVRVKPAPILSSWDRFYSSVPSMTTLYNKRTVKQAIVLATAYVAGAASLSLYSNMSADNSCSLKMV